MSCIFKIVCLLLLFSLTNASDGILPGLKARMSLDGIRQAFQSTVGGAIASSPDEFIDLGDFERAQENALFSQLYSLKSVRAASLDFSVTDTNLQGATVTTNFNLINMILTGEWLILIQTSENVIVNDTGNFMATVNQINIDYDILFTNINGLLRFEITYCNITNPDLESTITDFDGLDWQRNAFRGMLREQIRNTLCENFAKYHEEQVARVMSQSVTQLDTSGIDMDASLVGNITGNENGLLFNFVGRCFPQNNPSTNYGYSAGELPDFKQESDRTWQLAGDEYTLQTFLESLHLQGLVSINMTQDMLPPQLSGVLTTGIASLIVPGLRKFGQKPMMVMMDSVTAPRLSLTADGKFGMDGEIGLSFMVIKEEADLELAMYMTAMINSSATPSVKGDRLFSVLTDMSMEMMAGVSNVGEIPIEKMNGVMNQMIPFAINSLNNFASEGVKAPSVLNLDFNNLSLEINEGTFELQADFEPLPPK